MGFNITIKIGIINKFPNIEIKAESTGLIPRLIPKGIAPLNSAIGIIEVKNTSISFDKFIIPHLI